MEKINRTRQVFLHILACVAFLALPVVSSPSLGFDSIFSDTHVVKDIFSCALTIIFFYINFYFLIPRYYFTKRYFFFGLFVFLGFVIITAIPNIIFQANYPAAPPNDFNHHFHGPFRGMPPPHHHDIGPLNIIFFHISHNLIRFMLVFFISLMMKINMRYKAVQKEKVTSELSYLKSQINPHFLFNTLNGIYSLAVKKSEKTPDAIVALSGMMRYVLNEANNELVPLEKEIDYIQSYIDLQQNRFGSTLDLSLSIEGLESGYKIAPLILISFIENAFKYGVNPEEHSRISIVINQYAGELMFRVTNNKVSVRSEEVSQTGIGLENTLARLQLLYPAQHDISITDNDHEYIVFLILKLK